MSGKDRRLYLTATTLDQPFLNWCADNLENKLEMIVDIQTPDGFIHASDRNKYVDGTFYQALLNFPTISRTVGEWLTPEIQFSTLTLQLSNADGRYNKYLPAGTSFASWVGKTVEVKLGLSEIGATYKSIFKGKITELGGFKRDTKSIIITARDNYDTLSIAYPKNIISRSVYTKVQDDVAGKQIPIVYGDWSIYTDPDPAILPAIIINGRDPFVHRQPVDLDVDATADRILALNHCLDNNEAVQFATSGTLPTPLAIETTYYVVNRLKDSFKISNSPGGSSIDILDLGSGTHTFAADPGSAYTNIKFLIADNDLKSIDRNNVWMKRGALYYKVQPTEIVNVGAGNRTLEVRQNTAVLWVNGEAYKYESGDLFYLKCVGKDLGPYTDNLVEQARNLLTTYGGLSSGDFDTSWDVYRNKSSPAQSAVFSIKSRVWIQEPFPLIQYVLSMLEQVRLEAFVDRDLKLKINSLHFEDFNPSPTFTMKNWDVAVGTFTPGIDDRNNFNRAQGAFDLSPNSNENSKKTILYRNQAAINAIGKPISKQIVFPNLYVQTDVENQVVEILKMASTMFEQINVSMTWRAMLLDIGDFIYVDVKIGGSIFEKVPAMIRDIGYDPQGLKIPLKLWSMQMLPFPGYNPGYVGVLGGFNATIVSE